LIVNDLVLSLLIRNGEMVWELMITEKINKKGEVILSLAVDKLNNSLTEREEFAILPLGQV